MKSMTMRSLLLALALPAGAAAAPTSAPFGRAHAPQAATPGPLSSRELQAAVRRALSGYEPLDVDRELWRLSQLMGGHAAVADTLLQLLADAATPGLVRLRAIEALGYVPTAAGRAYLYHLTTEMSGGKDADMDFTLAAALRALGGFGATELNRIAPHLGHLSADVREAACFALRRVGTPKEVLPLLQARLGVEPDRGVKATLRTTIYSLRHAPPAP